MVTRRGKYAVSLAPVGGAPVVSGAVCPAQRPTKTRPDVTVGRILTEARRQRQLSLAAVSERLRIPRAQLQGLEEGDLSMFPAEVYARGAFEKYAAFLGVQAESTQRAFQRVLTGAREYVPLRVHRPKSWLAAKLTARWMLALVIAGVAALVGSYVAWQMISFVWLPKLQVMEPVSGMVESSTITVQGQAATNSTVHVNGQQVLLSEDGSFSMTMGIRPGVNAVQVEATNAAGRSVTVTREILRPRS